MKLTRRERFLKIAHFELTNDVFIPSWHQWFWYDTLVRWVKEGASTLILDNDHRPDYFGFERAEVVPVMSALMAFGKSFGPPYIVPFFPLFERKILKEEGNHRTLVDEGGRKIIEKINQTESMPQWLEYPIKCRKDWKEVKKRLNPDTPERFPAWWDDKVKDWKNRDYPLGIAVGSFYGFLREMIGVDHLSIMYYDDPKLVHEINEWLCYFELTILEKALESNVEFDWAYYWEDMAYNKGSLISPKLFKEFMMPHYKKINEVLRKHGTDIILVDCDGNSEELIPLWIESGLNGQYPLEVTARMDAVKLRKKYGKDFILIGNIDKMKLAGTKKDIDEEIAKVKDLISYGGYFVSADHFIPPDVPYENLVYWINETRKLSAYPETIRFIK